MKLSRALLAAGLLLSGSATAERIELPLGAAPPAGGGLWPALAQSLAGGGTGGEKAVLFPLSGPTSEPMMFQANTPGESADDAHESLRVIRHSGKADEQAATTALANELTMMCPRYPARMTHAGNGATLVERESSNCNGVTGYRLTISRFFKSPEGAMYQVTYVARRDKPDDTSVASWRTRLSSAKVVP